MLGYLDDLLLVLAEGMAEGRLNAKQANSPNAGLGKWGAVAIVCIWLFVLTTVGTFVYHLMKN